MILYKLTQRFRDGGILKHARLSKEMKDTVQPYIRDSSTYKKGKVFGLNRAPGLDGGVSMGADEDGFFIYTHRARSKSYSSPDKIPKKVQKFINSTG